MWTIIRPEIEEEAIDEIERQNDRGAAIIGAIFLEERLEHVIRERLIFRNRNIEKKLFNDLGPLSSFSSKIDLGHLLGMYNIYHHGLMHQVRKIRNKFAHSISSLTFSHADIKPLCDKLPTAKLLYESTASRDMSRFPGFIKWHESIVESLLELSEIEDSPRTRYINIVNICCFEVTAGLWVAEAAKHREDIPAVP
jgi:hypothetical protein